VCIRSQPLSDGVAAIYCCHASENCSLSNVKYAEETSSATPTVLMTYMYMDVSKNTQLLMVLQQERMDSCMWSRLPLYC
jgi:hypothetical protein